MAQSTSALEPNLQADENALATDKETRPAASASASTCPNEFLCPITKSLLRDPVLLVETGHSFERWAIQRWFAQGNMTCPLTGVALASIQVTPNLALRKLIQDWAARHPTHSAVLQSGPSTQDLYPQPNAAAALANGAQALPAFPPFAQALVNRRNAIGPVGRLIPCNPPRFFGGHVAQIQEAPLPAADDDEALDESARTPASEGEAPPAADPTLTLIPEFDTIGALPQEMLAVAHVVAPETGVRVPVDLVAVLDMSGSMAGPRLALVKETMMFVISQLQPSDRLSIVAFSHVARRAVKLTRATEAGKAHMRAAVQALSTEGGTSIASGLRLGLHALTSRRMRNPVACMFCLSDGQDNAGGPMPPGDNFAVRNRELLTSALREGVSVHTFGYGRDHDEEVLDSIAAGTSGTFTFIRDNCEVKEAVALSLGGALSVALQATTVQLTAAPGVAILAVSAGVYEATVDEAQASASVALKDLYSGETRDILIKLQLPAVSDETPPTPSLFGQLSYTLPGSADACQSPLVTLSLGRSGNSEQASPNIDVDIQRNRLKAAEAMREADRLAGGANLVLARGVIESTIDFIRGSPSAQEPACVGLLADLQQILRGLADARDYQSEGAKYAKSAARMHSSQRAAFTSTTGREPRGNAAMDQYASMSAISMRRTATIDNS